MPKSVQSTYSNTNTPQYEHHVFSRQAHTNSEQLLSTPALVPAVQRTETVGLTAGSPRTHPLDADLIGTSRFNARQPAKPTGEWHDQQQHQQPRVNGGQGSAPNTAPTHKRLLTQDRQHVLHKEEGDSHQDRDIHQPVDPRGYIARPLRGVWQDKGVFTNAMSASTQPAPDTKSIRARLTNNTVVRSHSVSVGRQKSGRITIWGIDPAIMHTLDRIAADEGLSLSQVGKTALGQWVHQALHDQHEALLYPMMRKLLREELRLFGNRLVFFLMRIAFASEHARILVANILDRVLRLTGADHTAFTSIIDKSNKKARRNIIAKTPHIKSLLDEWEASYKESGKEEA